MSARRPLRVRWILVREVEDPVVLVAVLERELVGGPQVLRKAYAEVDDSHGVLSVWHGSAGHQPSSFSRSHPGTVDRISSFLTRMDGVRGKSWSRKLT